MTFLFALKKSSPTASGTEEEECFPVFGRRRDWQVGRQERREGGKRGREADREQTLAERGGCLPLPSFVVRWGMQTDDCCNCKGFLVWVSWSVYICLAMALTLGRSDGPSGQGFSSLRVEALLSKMTLEDKVTSCFVFLLALHS